MTASAPSGMDAADVSSPTGILSVASRKTIPNCLKSPVSNLIFKAAASCAIWSLLWTTTKTLFLAITSIITSAVIIVVLPAPGCACITPNLSILSYACFNSGIIEPCSGFRTVISLTWSLISVGLNREFISRCTHPIS